MRCSLCALACLLLAVAAAHADRVTMPDKIELSGTKVAILDIRDTQVVVRVAYGQVTVPAERIVSMEVDYAARLQALEAEGKATPRALFRLGRVCDQLDQDADALDAYRRALAALPPPGPESPVDILLPLAQALEGHDAWAAAHKTYLHYLKLRPDDPEAQARAQAAKAKAEAQEPGLPPPPEPGTERIDITAAPPARKRAPAARPGEAAPAEPGEPGEPEPGEPEPAEAEPGEPEPAEGEPEKPKVQEGLEADPGWSSEAWGSTVEISVGVPKGGTNDKMLRVFLAGAEKEKANVMLEDDFDLSKKKAFVFDVHNFADQSISVAVAFITRPGWEFYESIPKTVLPTGAKPRTISIDLTSNRFKTAKTKWRFKSPLENRNAIIKVYFLLYTKVTGKWVLFNHIHFEDLEEAGPAPAAGEEPAVPAAPAPAAEE